MSCALPCNALARVLSTTTSGSTTGGSLAGGAEGAACCAHATPAHNRQAGNPAAQQNLAFIAAKPLKKAQPRIAAGTPTGELSTRRSG